MPAALGLNLELALNRGDAFVFSILLGQVSVFAASLLKYLYSKVKIIGLSSSRKRASSEGYKFCLFGRLFYNFFISFSLN